MEITTYNADGTINETKHIDLQVPGYVGIYSYTLLHRKYIFPIDTYTSLIYVMFLVLPYHLASWFQDVITYV